jgi:hypothetical protein
MPKSKRTLAARGVSPETIANLWLRETLARTWAWPA